MFSLILKLFMNYVTTNEVHIQTEERCLLSLEINAQISKIPPLPFFFVLYFKILLKIS